MRSCKNNGSCGSFGKHDAPRTADDSVRGLAASLIHSFQHGSRTMNEQNDELETREEWLHRHDRAALGTD